MLDISKDIHSLTDFKTNTPEHIDRLKTSGRPEVLTINGKAEVVVQDAAAYQRLLEDLEEAETVAQVGRAIQRVKNGDKGKPMLEFLQELAREHGIELKK